MIIDMQLGNEILAVNLEQEERRKDSFDHSDKIIDKNKKGVDIQKILQADNIAELLDEETIKNIEQRVIDEYQADFTVITPWLELMERIGKLVSLEPEPKHTPHQNANNVKWPIIAQACVHYTSMLKKNLQANGDEVITYSAAGLNPSPEIEDKQNRLAAYHNYLYANEMDWFSHNDRLIAMKSWMGNGYKKSFWNPIKDAPESIAVDPRDVIYDFKQPSFKELRRLSHKFVLYRNDIVTAIRSKQYLDRDYGFGDSTDENNIEYDKPYSFIEQHRWLDLDGDGYEEPYIVTICNSDSSSGTLARIVRRFEPEDCVVNDNFEIVKINPQECWTHYKTLEHPLGYIIGLGWGYLLYMLNDCVDQTINKLLDAGDIQNSGCGIIDALLFPGKSEIQLRPGFYQTVQMQGVNSIRDKIWRIDHPGPSPVLFNLLDMLMKAGEKLSISSDIFFGQSPGANVPATTVLSMVEQGMANFSDINNRYFQSVGEEAKKVFALLCKYKDIPDNQQYYGVESQYLFPTDFNAEDLKTYRVMPNSNNASVSDTQDMFRAKALMEVKGQGLNDSKIMEMYVRALKYKGKDLQELLPQEGAQPPQDPRIALEQAKIQLEQARLSLEAQEKASQHEERDARNRLVNAQTMKTEAEALAAQTGMLEAADAQQKAIQMSELLNQFSEVYGDSNDSVPMQQSGQQPTGATAVQ